MGLFLIFILFQQNEVVTSLSSSFAVSPLSSHLISSHLISHLCHMSLLISTSFCPFGCKRRISNSSTPHPPTHPPTPYPPSHRNFFSRSESCTLTFRYFARTDSVLCLFVCLFVSFLILKGVGSEGETKH